jgi:hypothetical protein
MTSVWKRAAGWAILVLAAAGVAGTLAGWESSESRVTALCAQLKPGTPVSELGAFARANSFLAVSAKEGLNYLSDKKSMGRNLCRVTVKGGVVESSEYLFLD